MKANHRSCLGVAVCQVRNPANPVGRGHAEDSTFADPAFAAASEQHCLHPKTQIDKLVRAIGNFGFSDSCNHRRPKYSACRRRQTEAARKGGLQNIPCIRASHLTEVQKRTFILVDNRLAEDAAWDFQLLAKEVEFLQSEGIDLTITGFEMPEIEMILDVANPPAVEIEDDKVPGLAQEDVVTKSNDIWILGEHRLFCGDARRRELFATLLTGEKAQLVFVDPPYNVKIRGHVSGKGRVKHREFAQASGEKNGRTIRKIPRRRSRPARRTLGGRLDTFCMFGLAAS